MSRELRAILVGDPTVVQALSGILPSELDGRPIRPAICRDMDEAISAAAGEDAVFLLCDGSSSHVKLLTEVAPVICLNDGPTSELRRQLIGTGAAEVIDRLVANEHLVSAVIRLAGQLHASARLNERAARALRTAESRLQNLIERIADGVVIVDSEGGEVLAVNPAAEQIFGRPASGLLGQPFGFPLVVGSTAEIEIIRPGDKPASAEMRVVEMHWDAKPALLASLRDITSRKLLEEQLRQSQKMEAVGRLAGGVAHEFNNLLTAITGYSDLLLSRIKDGDGLRHDLYEIKNAASRASSITRQLLTFSRRHPVRPHVFDLRGLVKGIEPMLRRVVGESIELRLELPLDAGYIKAESSQIEQVLLNLSLNARDAMPTGGRLTICVRNIAGGVRPGDSIAIPPGEWVLLSIADTGQGIHADVMPRIFEPFFSTKEPDAGAGLGLAIVYSVVQQCGGQVTVESRPGEGANFRVLLPRVPAPMPAGTDAERKGGHQATILLVEDQDVVRIVTRRLLQTAGYNVLEACDGQQALKIFRQRHDGVDLLLTDVVMPVMSGVELAEHLSGQHSHLPILFMSGFTRDEVLHDTRTGTPAHFIQKPFTRDQLLSKVRDVIAAEPNALQNH